MFDLFQRKNYYFHWNFEQFWWVLSRNSQAKLFFIILTILLSHLKYYHFHLFSTRLFLHIRINESSTYHMLHFGRASKKILKKKIVFFRRFHVNGWVIHWLTFFSGCYHEVFITRKPKCRICILCSRQINCCFLTRTFQVIIVVEISELFYFLRIFLIFIHPKAATAPVAQRGPC